MTLEFKTIDTSTIEGFKRAIELKASDEWRMVTSSFLGTEVLFEKIPQQFSDCCEANIILNDVCSKCIEHCEKIEL